MALNSLVFAATLTAVASDAPADEAWEAFKSQFGKSYNSEDEEAQRKEVFVENFAQISEHNKAGTAKYSLGVNQFADLTNSEWSATYNGAVPPSTVDDSNDDLPYLGQVEEQPELADSIDWVSRGAVTPVKNQGHCGSCWSFSTTGAMEGSYQVATSQLLSLAEQQLVDCDRSNSGCSGGWPYMAMTYASRNGACLESSYPYTARGGSCHASSCTMGLKPGTVSGYMHVGQTTSALLSALNSQPVSVTVDAGEIAFQFYSNGVINHGCYGQINHAVLATGYGTSADGTKYWRIKNSWGASWGESGYFNLERGVGSQGDACILQEPPAVAKIAGSISV
jgi:C1A family cysteine protease